jgi:nucleoside-diphosphate-sugar epimerase
MSKIDLSNKTILVTGAAGFIGSFLCKRLLETVTGALIVGLDSITDY